VVGLKELHLSPSNLGLLFASMGIGSVLAAVFILPWARAHFSPNTLTRLAALLLSIVYVLMALIRETPAFLLVAALAGVVWTISAAELWVAAQRAMPGWARGRMNATVIMVSQGAMALGGIIWGTIAAMAGVNTALIVAAVLVLATLTVTHLLRHPWSIDFTITADPDSVPGLPASPCPTTSPHKFSLGLFDHFTVPEQGVEFCVAHFRLILSRRDRLIVARHEVPGKASLRRTVPEGTV
jgi:MFS family permease